MEKPVSYMADHVLRLSVCSSAPCVALLKCLMFLTEKGKRYSPLFVVDGGEATRPDAALGLA